MNIPKNNLIIAVIIVILAVVLYFIIANDDQKGMDVTKDEAVEQKSEDESFFQDETKRVSAEERAVEYVISMPGIADNSNPQILSTRYGLDECPQCYEFVVQVGSGDTSTDVIVEVKDDDVEGWITK